MRATEPDWIGASLLAQSASQVCKVSSTEPSLRQTSGAKGPMAVKREGREAKALA